MTVINMTTRAHHVEGITCEGCGRSLEPDWVLFTGRRWLCGQCLGSEGYDTGFREVCSRLGIDVADAVSARPSKPNPVAALKCVEAELDRLDRERATFATAHNPKCECEWAEAMAYTVHRIRTALTEGSPQ